PIARAGVDVWDWNLDRALAREGLTQKLAAQLALDGYFGIVLHPRHLRDRSNKLRLLNLLNYLEEERSTTVSLRDVALGKIEAASVSARIGRLRRTLGRGPGG